MRVNWHLTEVNLSARTAKILNSIDEIDAATWDAHANPPGVAFNPFLTHRFFKALEDSGSAAAASGWQPCHVQVEDHDGTLGVVPMYLKGHSQGEYVFDYSWADAWQRAGGRYYPKLQVSVPFTPASGRRLLTARDDPDTVALLLGALAQVADQMKVSSLHATFMQEPEWRAAGEMGYLRRMDQQYHWRNPGYASFDDFLADLSSKKRKNVRRERRGAVENGIDIEWVTGRDLTEDHWDAFYRFYTDTGSRKWGSPYLTRAFFSQINETMADETLLIMARRDGRYIAGALNFIGSETLFGRNWGCIEDHRFLHFEVCYYQAIDFAIARGLHTVEAGAQGAHKVARGYLPTATYSAHWIGDPGFREAVDRYLQDERNYVQQDIDFTEAHTPFKSSIDIRNLKAAAESGPASAPADQADPPAAG